MDLMFKDFFITLAHIIFINFSILFIYMLINQSYFNQKRVDSPLKVGIGSIVNVIPCIQPYIGTQQANLTLILGSVKVSSTKFLYLLVQPSVYSKTLWNQLSYKTTLHIPQVGPSENGS